VSYTSCFILQKGTILFHFIFLIYLFI